MIAEFLDLVAETAADRILTLADVQSLPFMKFWSHLVIGFIPLTHVGPFGNIFLGAVLAKRDAWARIAGCMREEAGSVVGSAIV